MEPLHAIHIFSKLDASNLSSIESMLKYTTFNENEIILSHGEQSTAVYFLLEGTVRSTTYSMSGREICFQHLAPGEMFGELSAIDSLPRTTSIIAKSNCRLGILTARQLWQLMEEHPNIMASVLKRLTSMVRFLCSRVYEYGALGTRERTRVELLRMAKDNMTGDQDAVIENMPTHEAIANKIASHREAVTKELSHLVKRGLIEKNGKTLIIPNVNALSATIVENIA